MINITERAKQKLKIILTTSADWPDARLRLIDRGQGKLGLGLDIENPDDKIVEHEGKKLLLIESALANNVKRITLDVESTPDGDELVISEKP